MGKFKEGEIFKQEGKAGGVDINWADEFSGHDYTPLDNIEKEAAKLDWRNQARYIKTEGYDELCFED